MLDIKVISSERLAFLTAHSFRLCLLDSFTNSMKLSFVAFLSVVAMARSNEDKCQAPGTLTCMPISSGTSVSVGRQISTPSLDGDLSDWADVTGIVTPIKDIFGKMYEEGDATYKCLYDEEKIYL